MVSLSLSAFAIGKRVWVVLTLYKITHTHTFHAGTHLHHWTYWLTRHFMLPESNKKPFWLLAFGIPSVVIAVRPGSWHRLRPLMLRIQYYALNTLSCKTGNFPYACPILFFYSLWLPASPFWTTLLGQNQVPTWKFCNGSSSRTNVIMNHTQRNIRIWLQSPLIWLKKL